jgi:hypothetical protein
MPAHLLAARLRASPHSDPALRLHVQARSAGDLAVRHDDIKNPERTVHIDKIAYTSLLGGGA